MAVDGAWGREAANKYSWYGPSASFTTGMFAAQVAAVFTNPIDVVKVRNLFVDATMTSSGKKKEIR